MRITRVVIEKFRSIQALTFEATPLTAVCGPNSCGKSNVLRAIRFAFLPTYDPGRMPDNVCHQVLGPNAACLVKLTFDRPTASLANSLGLPLDREFTYSVSVKRSGKRRTHLNGGQLTDDRRKTFLDGVLVVHVPPVRDIAADGLKPFRDTLAIALRKTKGDASFSQLNERARNVVRDRGRRLLVGTKAIAERLLRAKGLVVDADGIDLQHLLPSMGLNVLIGNREIGLDKLGTGHQSSVILKLYRQLGDEAGRFVLYLFEEPDNHLHPTSLRAIGEDLADCAGEGDSQVFLTTHSPYLLNQFEHGSVLALGTDSGRLTVKRPKSVSRPDRSVRIALGTHGLKVAEALLADRVVIVEGPNDVTIVRTLIELKTGVSPDRQDILIVPAGGKQPATDLAYLMHELGANWRICLDWDATESTSVPMFQPGLALNDVTRLVAATTAIKAKLRTLPTKVSKAGKLIDAMAKELTNPATPGAGFAGSVLETFLRKLSRLDAGERAKLETAISARQPVKARGILSANNVWLWSDSIEAVIVRNTDAENDVEKILRAKGRLPAVFATPIDRRRALLNCLHDSAHEPAFVREVVRTLWKRKRFDHSEVKTSLAFLLG